MKRILCVYTFIFFTLLIMACPSLLSAGQVTLGISTTTSVSDSSIAADIRIANNGTEAARQVSVTARFQDEQRSVFIADTIGSGQSAQSETLIFKKQENLSGTFPLFVTVSYQHSNGISVASASLASINTGVKESNNLEIKATLGKGGRKGKISIHVEAKNPEIKQVTITPHTPGDLAIEPPVKNINLEQGKGEANFSIKNLSGSEGNTYGVFFAAQYESEGVKHFASAEIAVPVKDVLATPPSNTDTLKTWFYAIFLALIAALLILVIASSGARRWLFRVESIPHLLDILVLAAVEVFIFSKFDLATLVSATTTTGGDTASHFYTLEYLRHTLLPAGKVTGWTMGNYGGFPILQFYFPLPFLIMCLLDLVMPLQVAFKLVTVLGTALLPVAAYTMLRLMRCPFPGPGIAGLLTLPFLFNTANSMWGGNILSTLAGEFSYSFSMALSLILIGSLYRGAHDDKGIIRNGILVFLVGFSHGYTLLFAEAVSLFLLLVPYGFSRRVAYLFRVYALGFCLLAFWLVPLLVFTKYTTSYHLVWTIRSMNEIVPDIFFPVVVTGITGSILLLILGGLYYKKSGREPLMALAYLWFGLAAAVVFFVAAPRLGVVDIRYVPYGQLMTCLMAALFLGWAARYFLNRWGLSWILLIILAVATFHWTDSRVGSVKSWSKWNYEGFESKTTWSAFERINNALSGTFQDPRVVFEHSNDHNRFGSSRAFESLPLFAGRATLEGLYMQASISAPFVFYIQSLVSRATSQPFPQYNYTSMDFDRARNYLELFNVRDLIIKSSKAKQAIKQTQGYLKVKSIGQYEIWGLAANKNRYIEPLPFEPILYRGKDPWKQVAHQWFTRDELLDTHLVFDDSARENDTSYFTLTAHSLTEIRKQEIDISGCEPKETIKNNEILLETNCPGKPHLIKVSYHPSWHVEGAEKIYLASPSFMLVYPTEKKVRLFYGPGPWDRLGQLLTLFGLLVLLLNVPLPGKEQKAAWSILSSRFGIPPFQDFRLPIDPGPAARKIILISVFIGASVLVVTGSYHVYTSEPYRSYKKSILYKDAKEYDRARQGFRSFVQNYPLASLGQESRYYIAITYYLEKNHTEAMRAFEEYIENYPQGKRVAESLYHIGLIHLRGGQQDQGFNSMKQLIEKYPGTPWAKYGGERLLERGFTPSGEQLNINSSNLEYFMGRAISYFNKDRLEDAKPILLQISERFPDFAGAPQALAALALSYYKVGDCAGTIKYYQKLVQRYPDNRLIPEALFHIGLCYEKEGNKEQSREFFKTLLNSHPQTVYGKQAQEKIN